MLWITKIALLRALKWVLDGYGLLTKPYSSCLSHFTDWCKRMIDYGFEENIDYKVFHNSLVNPNPLGGRTSSEYFLTIDAAKEISMLQRSKKGREARKYFLDCYLLII